MGAILGWLWYLSSKLSVVKRYLAKGALIGYLSSSIVNAAIAFLLLSLFCGVNGELNCDFGAAILFGFINLAVLIISILVGAGIGYRYGKRKINIMAPIEL